VALLKGDVLTASRLLLLPRGTDDPRVSAALLEFTDKGSDGKELLRFMPSDMVAARVLVSQLSRAGRSGGSLDRFSPGQLRDALAAVPYNLKTLFVNAYQSFLFNTLLSERVERFGADRVVPGDLVVKPSHTMDAVEMCRAVRVASAEEIAAGAWTIEDVVLPLVGYTLTAFPTHAVGRQRVAELCQLDGVDLLSSKSNSRLTPMGSYRHILIKPRDVEHEWIWYNHARQANVDWNTTDLDRLHGIAPPKQAEGDDIDRAALRIAFSLSPSSYATMGFRELMKQPTDRSALKGAPS
jgi:tRNA pseudouridine13 synthase